MSECVTCTPEQIAEQRQQRDQARKPPAKPLSTCETCGKEFNALGTAKNCSYECSNQWRRMRARLYKQGIKVAHQKATGSHKRKDNEAEGAKTLNITKRQRQAVIQAANRYEKHRAEWGRCKSREDVASIRSELDAAEHALARALSRQGLRVATVAGLRYRVDAVGELVRQEVVRAIHRNEQPRRAKADAAARA